MNFDAFLLKMTQFTTKPLSTSEIICRNGAQIAKESEANAIVVFGDSSELLYYAIKYRPVEPII